MTTGGPVSVREATLGDRKAITALQARFGLNGGQTDEEVFADWQRFWVDNPALTPHRRTVPIGWVLESAGTIVGYLGNIAMRYHHGSREIEARAARGYVVEKPFRAHTNDLAAAYFDQKAVDLFLLTSSNRAVGRICERFGAVRLPQRDYDRVLTWVLDQSSFLTAALRRKRIPAGLTLPARWSLSLPMSIVGAAQRSRIGRVHTQLSTDAIPFGDLGNEFDTLWDRAILGKRRLLAFRKAADIRWHVGQEAAKGRLTIVRCRREHQLRGFVLLTREGPEALGFIRGRILDLFTDSGDPAVVDSLLIAAYRMSESSGCHALELVGLPREVRARAKRLWPIERRFPTFPYYYKATSPGLAEDLSSEDSWYPSLYDGDSSL